MPHFKALIKRFTDKGEKTGWTYIEVPAAIAEEMKPGNKKSFRVKGKIDHWEFEGLSLLPMGGGDFILALNATIRKAIKKQQGAIAQVQMDADDIPYQLNTDLVRCISDDQEARTFFEKLPLSYKNYYSKWIDGAKTETTRIRRIVLVVNALAAHMDFGGMIRKERDDRRLIGR